MTQQHGRDSGSSIGSVSHPCGPPSLPRIDFGTAIDDPDPDGTYGSMSTRESGDGAEPRAPMHSNGSATENGSYLGTDTHSRGSPCSQDKPRKAIIPRTQSTLQSAFISIDKHGEFDSPVRSAVSKVLYHGLTEAFIAGMVFFHLYLMCLEIDAKAAKPGGQGGSETPVWVQYAMYALYVLFLVELLVRIYVEQEEFHHNFSNIADFGLVVLGTLEYLTMLAGVKLHHVGLFRVLRLIRLLRLLRVVKLFAMIKELRKLIMMMGSCFKTLIWSTLLLFVVMTLWACIAVEVLNPCVQSLDLRGHFSDCERCGRAFSTVFDANLTLFKTIIAGDSWGLLAVPIVENYPLTAVVFIGAHMTLVFGVLNLVVAVVVDVFAENRSKDVESLAQELDLQEFEDKRVLGRIFTEIDKDNSGGLCLDELVDGAKKVAEFRNWLRVLDIDQSGLRELFEMVDEDRSGEIDPEEFIEAMYRMKNTESKTATRLVKHHVSSIDKRLNAMDGRFHSIMQNLTKSKSELGMVDEDEDPLADRVDHEEAALQKRFEGAMNRASQVALEAALHAGSAAAHKVMSTVRLSSRQLAGRLSTRVDSGSIGTSGSAQVAGFASSESKLASRTSSQLEGFEDRCSSYEKPCRHDTEESSLGVYTGPPCIGLSGRPTPKQPRFEERSDESCGSVDSLLCPAGGRDSWSPPVEPKLNRPPCGLSARMLPSTNDCAR